MKPALYLVANIAAWLALATSLVLHRVHHNDLKQHRRNLDRLEKRTNTIDERTYQLRGDWHTTEQELSVVRDTFEDHLQIHHQGAPK